MSDESQNSTGSPDPAEYTKTLAEIAERSQAMVNEFLTRQTEGGGFGHADPMNIGGAFLEMTRRLMSDPHKLIEAQVELWQDYMNLWQNATRRLMGEDIAPTVVPSHGDRRFKDAAWEEDTVFDFIKQSYLLTARWMQNTVSEVEGLDEQTSKKVDFYTRQFVDAMAPSNFLMTNPEVLRETLESNGENLVRG
ncbi:MAG: class I poly(R)-hydroxyalkanoic acid synthase, partial [Alphaproteobacteria bacterium]